VERYGLSTGILPEEVNKQAGKRPALVIQNDIGNEKAATTILAAIFPSKFIR
jgi:mRNA-degrading endonuclease toxin of MazEF toxin-antitoxin module